MTEKQLYEGALIEVNKEGAPSFHLREFNYYANEAASEVIDDLYIAFETGQKVLDYLKGIKRTFEVPEADLNPGIYDDSEVFTLPSDYRHLTNLIVKYEVDQPIYDTCYQVGDIFSYGSQRLDSDTYASIISDPFARPKYHKPKHIIVDNRLYILTGAHAGLNVTKVVMDYLKTPKVINLTYQQAFQDTIDNSAQMEFDEITNRKILDKLVLKLLEKFRDQRAGSQPQVNQIQQMPDIMPNVNGRQNQ